MRLFVCIGLEFVPSTDLAEIDHAYLRRAGVTGSNPVAPTIAFGRLVSKAALCRPILGVAAQTPATGSTVMPAVLRSE